MHELDNDGAFAHAGGDAFDGAVTHVADDKNSGDAGFEQAGIAAERPGSGLLAIVNELRAGENEAAVVALDDVAEPFGARQRADEDEEAGGRQVFRFTGRSTLDGEAGEAR